MSDTYAEIEIHIRSETLESYTKPVESPLWSLGRSSMIALSQSK